MTPCKQVKLWVVVAWAWILLHYLWFDNYVDNNHQSLILWHVNDLYIIGRFCLSVCVSRKSDQFFFYLFIFSWKKYKGIIGLDEDENNVIMWIVVLVDKILRKAPLAAQSISARQIRIQWPLEKTLQLFAPMRIFSSLSSWLIDLIKIWFHLLLRLLPLKTNLISVDLWIRKDIKGYQMNMFSIMHSGVVENPILTLFFGHSFKISF